MRTLALVLTSLALLGAGEAMADRDNARGNQRDSGDKRALYSEQSRGHGQNRDYREERRDDRRSDRREDHRGHDYDRRDWRDDRRDDRHSEHRHRDRHDHDWRDRDHRHYRDYDRHHHTYYYSPAPRRVIYVNDGYGHYRHYHLRHDYYSHFYDPFYFHNGIHIHAGCHYHHFGDALAAGIVIGAILGDW